MSDDAPAQFLRHHLLHVSHVQRAIRRITTDLEESAESHDHSKLRRDEFDGYTNIIRAALAHPYGTPEYQTAFRNNQDTIKQHYSRNTHHPEYWINRAQIGEGTRDMGFLDIIEMVCDWYGAWTAFPYKPTDTWNDAMSRMREKYRATFSDAQWWLVEQVAKHLGTIP